MGAFMAKNMHVRRVVTGQDRKGKAVVASDEVLEATGDKQSIGLYLWGADEPARFPNDGSKPPMSGGNSPGPSGYRIVVMTIAPDSEWPNQKQRMHATDTVDLQVVISGELSMELDDGVCVHVKPGEFIIQNGTIHRWFNRGSVPTLVAAVIFGAHSRSKE
jgi:mannose-6-phosphate isomerase-like protein (cupin superfamily)